MPIISQFLGIIIIMYYNDHNPPHFHARYGEYEITVFLETGVIEGNFPRRALRLVMEWYLANKDALEDNWKKARTGIPLEEIPPLE